MSNDIIHITSLPAGWRDRLDLFLATQGQGFNAHLLSRSRLHDIAALESCSDIELLHMGLRRHQIPAFVFADLFGCESPDEPGSA